jgi:hypothetical protein
VWQICVLVLYERRIKSEANVAGAALRDRTREMFFRFLARHSLGDGGNDSTIHAAKPRSVTSFPPSSFILCLLCSQRPGRRYLSENQRSQTKIRRRLMRMRDDSDVELLSTHRSRTLSESTTPPSGEVLQKKFEL